MELVYLRVEDYKNIKKQGFNFSPRVECKFYDEYDEDGKLKDNCKLEIKPKEHIENFFGDNINITAIVGKNGSGKSSVLHLLLKNIAKLKDNEKSIILLFREKTEIYLYKNFDKTINNNEAIIHQYSLLNEFDNTVSLYINNQTSLNHELVFIEEERQMNIVNPNINLNKTKKIILQNFMRDENRLMYEASKDFFIPKKVRIKVKLFEFDEDKEYYDDTVLKKIEANLNEAKEFLKNYQYKDFLFKLLDIMKIKSTEYKQPTPTPLTNFDLMPDGSYSHNLENKYIFSEGILLGYNDLISNLERKDFSYNEQSTIQIFYEFDIEEVNEHIISFIWDLPELIFDIELVDENKIFETLSYGEQQLLIQLNYILFYSQKNNYVRELPKIYNVDGEEHEVWDDVNFDIKNLIITLDEFELGLHPLWQKKIITYLVDFLKLLDKNFHLIITSHSPFLLSDIPKQNIIFLDTYKEDDIEVKNVKQREGNCKVVEGLSQTFGANVHTLLSDSFFMEDGLMGEFAKNKIQEIMDFLNNEKTIEEISTKEEQIKQVIESIGEDLLRMKLLDMYYEKFEDEELEKEKQQLLEKEKEIRKLIDSIEKKQNDTN